MTGLLCLSNLALAAPGTDQTFESEQTAKRLLADRSSAESQSSSGWQTAAVHDDDSRCTPGLTVARSVTDRHAPQDVGGRLDVTKPWRLNIPDPVTGNSQYRSITGANVVQVSQSAPAPKTVTPCFDQMDELAIDQSQSQNGRQLTYAQLNGAGGSASRSLWWASSSRAPLMLTVGSMVVTSGFGRRYHPILRTVRGHDGVDLAAPIGTPIYATQHGVVRSADWNGGYGLFVSLDHGAGVETRFGHMSRLNVVEGQRVRKGQIIGYVGSTGLSTGPHLHYELRVNGQAMNPLIKPRN